MNNETDIEVTSYVESNKPAPQLPMQLSPLQEQLLESAREMGLDVDWFQKEVLTDPICLNGLQLVED
jgi:predicted outer membrane protein